MTYPRYLGIAVLPLVLLAAGCDQVSTVELPKVEMHEPGVYRGKPDPLLEIAGTPDQAKKLQNRIMQIQTDR